MTNTNFGRTTRRGIKEILAVGALAGMLAACSNVEPMSYTPIDEIPAGSGLFSGEDGVFTLYETGRSEEAEEKTSEP